MGEGIDSVEITELNISIDKRINKDDIIITVETEKASMEICSDHSGIITEINISKNDFIKPGSIIAKIKLDKITEDIKHSNVKPDKNIKHQSNNLIKMITLPDIGEGINDVIITEINTKIGEFVKKNDTIITVETEKASMEIPIKEQGIISEIIANKNDSISPGMPILNIELSNLEIPKKDEQTKTDDKSIPKEDNLIDREQITNNPIRKSKIIYTSPSVRRFSRKLGCDLTLVQGTGPKGRILKEDVEKYISNILNGQNAYPTSTKLSKVDFGKFGEVSELNLNKIRKTTGSRLQTAWNTIPQVTQFDQCDITDLDIYRKNLSKDKNIKMSFIPFFIKALEQTLIQLPDFNSSLNSDQNKLILKKYINIGIAVDTPNGLIVPVIKDVTKKNIFIIMDELLDISTRSKSKKIIPEELQGSCMTISSLGGIGGTYFTPIVNPPEVAIIGISKASIQPYYNGKGFEPKKILPLSLTYDHRVIDGAAAAKFTTLFSNYLTNYKNIPGIIS